MRKILYVFLLCVSSVCFAANDFTCAPLEVKMQNKNIILPGVDEPRTTKIYFLQNVSNQSLWLDHPVDHPSASAGWSSYSLPGKWSAILLNRKNFAISCAVINPGKVDYQDCSKVISVCTSKNAVFDSKRKGSYWLAENLTKDDMLKILEKRGVVFHEKSDIKKVN